MTYVEGYVSCGCRKGACGFVKKPEDVKGTCLPHSLNALWLFRTVKGIAGYTRVQADIVTWAVIINCRQGLNFSFASKWLFAVKRIAEP